jgi:metal-responsive CopG/Arc/MetJ family transcriptional regulator
MSISLPAELLESVIERAKRDKVTRSAVTIKALTAYLEGTGLLEAGTHIELIRLRTQLESRDEIIRRADETIAALKLALEIHSAEDARPRARFEPASWPHRSAF